MNMNEVKEIAAKRGIKAGKAKKAELIRAMQQAEGNPACYETGRAKTCGESKCLWKEDCR